MPNWAAGWDAAMDVTVVNPMQAATLVHAATTQGYALSLTRRHEELPRTAGGKELRSFPWLLSHLVAGIEQLWER